MWLLFSNLGQDFAVQGYVSLFEHVNKARIAETVFTHSGIDLQCPQVAESALLGAAVAESVLTGLEHGWASETNLALATPLEAFNALQETLAALYMLCTSFYAWHKLFAIRHQGLNGLGQSLGEANVGTLIASDIAGFTGIEVILASLTLRDFASAGNFYPFGGCFMCLHCHK